ncbi:MAG: endo-1,3-alpha-glucanase family glycosylhydrolase [Caldilineaceae bacterium]
MPAAQSSADPLVFAFYYTWFDENTWSYDKLSDLPAEPYVSRDRGVMGRHIDQAKAAGIDAFLVAWYGPGGDTNQTEPNLTALLEEAATRNFKIGILFETDSPFLGGTDAITGALHHALQVHASQPAFLRVDGRPVIFFWRPTIYGVDTWRTVRNQVDPGYGSLWIAEGVDTSYLTLFDGHYLYSNTWNPPTDLAYTNQKFANLVGQARQQQGTNKLWISTVMPGYNDLRIRPNGGFAKDREGGAYYERSWQAAIASAPNWVVITSFNEWPEGSYIEPSTAFGGQYLGLTAAWSAQFKTGGPRPDPAQFAAAPVVAAAAAAPAPTPTPFQNRMCPPPMCRRPSSIYAPAPAPNAMRC